ncbi:MAG: prepilin peptidase [Candidatus Pacebacteria bacterium]|nr:prepilin peptidase [Candidatus Paceibacterota bacterium]
MIILIFLVLGLIVGSFLNVLVYRLHTAEDIVWDRSRCPRCHHVIGWYDNVPVVSFVLLKARCRNCKKKISWQYPLVEIGTGVMFALAGAYFFNVGDPASWGPVIYLLGVLFALVAIFVYDALYLEIPDIVLWPAVVWVLAFGFFFSWNMVSLKENIFDIAMLSRFLGAAAAFAFFWLMARVSREKWMGMGDAWLVLLLGLILGWPRILLALFLAFLIGSIYGIMLIAVGKYTLKSRVPFAPFLVLGTLIALFFYAPIVGWYLGLF